MAKMSGDQKISGIAICEAIVATLDLIWNLYKSLTAAKMAMCRWLDPFLVVRIEFLEWTPENRLRHPRFGGIRSARMPTR